MFLNVCLEEATRVSNNFNAYQTFERLKKPAGIFVDAIRLSHLQVSAYFVNTQAEQLLYAAAGAFTFGYKPF